MQLYNTLTRQKEEFVPLHEGEVRIYACGPTVYNFFHIGNARAFVVFDTMRRYFEYLGYRVTFVQNFTDIDDKMILRANAEGISVDELAERYIEEYYRDADALGVKRAAMHPRATEHIPEIIALIEKLIERNHAYVAENGDVYYAPDTFADYGKLSGQPLEDLLDGARVDPEDVKHSPADFALWKAKKEGEPYWESPWGEGRPGWHIECSAMSMKYLGESFDIHCGGVDLTFPHHENEIAQSEGATGHPYVKYWVHNGYINVDNKKMSKSAGNFFTVRDIVKEYDPQVVRLFLISAQYRTPINFSQELMEQANSSWERMKNAVIRWDELTETGEDGEADHAFIQQVHQYKDDFLAGMNDDLNTAEAIGALFSLIRDANARFNEGGKKSEACAASETLCTMLDILGLTPKIDAIPENVNALVEARNEARKNKDWAKSDALRDEIEQLGFAVEDGKDGTIVKKI